MRALIVLSALIVFGPVMPSSEGGAFDPGPTIGQAATMTNADVLRLVKAGLSDALVERSIRQSPSTKFSLEPRDLVALKEGGVSDAIVTVMFDVTQADSGSRAPAGRAAATPPAPATQRVAPDMRGIPDEIGVYVRVRNGYAFVEPEIVTWRTGGAWKRFATAGILGGHLNGQISGPTSSLAVPSSAEFVVVAPEGTAISEYQLLRLFTKSTRREFRAMSSDIRGARSGADANLIDFDGTRIAPRTYKVVLRSLPPGEYGLLPPVVSGVSLASSGKIYSFAVR